MKAVILAAVIVCLLLVGGALFFTGHDSGSSATRITPLDPTYTQRMQSGYWSRGNTTNPKTVVEEYADFQCLSCAAIYPVIEDVIKQNAQTVELKFYQYPFEARNNKARLAAQAAEAAGRQGKFWQMHELLFANQTTWQNQSVDDFHDTVALYAKSLNLNVSQFKADLADNSINDGIDNDLTLGNKLPVQAVPTILINGTVLQDVPQTTDQFNALIKAAQK